MQVEVHQIDDTQKQVEVTFPAAVTDRAFKQRFQRLQKTAKIPGFRKGKIPQRVIAQRFGAEVREEVMRELLDNAWRQILSDESLNVVGRPELDGLPPRPGSDYQFTINIEVAPKIEIGALSDFKIERERWEVPEARLESELDKVRKSSGPWVKVEETRTAAEGDRVTFSLQGLVDGEARPEFQVNDEQAILGSKNLLPELEAAFVGAEPGASLEATVQFPEDSQNTAVAGREVVFQGSISQLESRSPLDDEALLKEMGLSDLDALRDRLRERLLQQPEQEAFKKAKDLLIEQIQTRYDFALPPRLLAEQAQRILSQEHDRADGDEEGSAGRGEEEEREAAAKAEKFLRLDFFVDAVAQQAELKVEESEVERHIRSQLMSANEFAPQLDQMFRRPEMRARLKSSILEDKVFEHLLSNSTVTELPRALED